MEGLKIGSNTTKCSHRFPVATVKIKRPVGKPEGFGNGLDRRSSTHFGTAFRYFPVQVFPPAGWQATLRESPKTIGGKPLVWSENPTRRMI
jgi:hypothetical protein